MTSTAENTSQFDALLGELETLAKAIPNDDGSDVKIQAAADEAKEGDDEKDDKSGEGDETVTKSFKAVIDGKEVEAFDGAELVKSLTTQLTTSEASRKSNEEKMLKALGTLATFCKSLQDQVIKLSSAGRGRRSTVDMTGDTSKAAPTQQSADISHEDLMTKAMQAHRDGRITGTEANSLDVAHRYGVQPDAALIKKVLG